MLLIDLEEGRIISDEEIKSEMAQHHHINNGLDENLVAIQLVE